MILLEVVLVLGFITNLVSLDLLNQKGVHQNSENLYYLSRNQEKLINLVQVDYYQVLCLYIPLSSFIIKKSTEPLYTNFIVAQIYRILVYASLEAIGYVQKASRDITIDIKVLVLTTIQCETYSLSKVKEQISRRSKVEDIENGKPFYYIIQDLGHLQTAQNGHRYYSYMYYTKSKFNILQTYAKISDALLLFEVGIKYIKV